MEESISVSCSAVCKRRVRSVFYSDCSNFAESVFVFSEVDEQFDCRCHLRLLLQERRGSRRVTDPLRTLDRRSRRPRGQPGQITPGDGKYEIWQRNFAQDSAKGKGKSKGKGAGDQSPGIPEQSGQN